jgi:hypothetical protein
MLREFEGKLQISMSHHEHCEGETIDLSWSSYSCGGLVTMLRRSAFGPVAAFEDPVAFSNGCLMPTAATKNSCLVAFYNMHIYDIKRPHLLLMAASVEKYLLFARQGLGLLYAMGDVNDIRPDEAPFYAKSFVMFRYLLVFRTCASAALHCTLGAPQWPCAAAPLSSLRPVMSLPS